jgi:hypothetical protein
LPLAVAILDLRRRLINDARLLGNTAKPLAAVADGRDAALRPHDYRLA